MKNQFDYLYSVFNITIWFLLWVFSIILIFVMTNNWIVRIVMVVISHFVSAALEERVLSKHVNSCVERLISYLDKKEE